MVVGGLLITLGHRARSGPRHADLDRSACRSSSFGLALIAIGTGHFKPCVSVMVGQLYAGTTRAATARSPSSTWASIRRLPVQLVCGTLASKYGWHWGFGSAAVGMILGLIFYAGRQADLSRGSASRRPAPASASSKAWIFLPVGLALASGVGLLYKAGVLGMFDDFVSQTRVYVTLLVASVAYAVWFIARQAPGDRGPVATIFIYMLFNAVFWLASSRQGRR